MARLIYKLLAPVAGTRMKKIGANMGWLLFEKLLRYGLALVVGFWLARSLGKEGFGVLNSAIAFVTLFTALYTLGMDSVVVKELTEHPSQRPRILGTAFLMRFMGSVITALVCLLYHYVRSDTLYFQIVLITTLMPVLQTFEVPDFYFQSETRSKMTVLGKFFGLMAVLTLRIIFILIKAPLIWFAWANIAEFLTAALAIMYIYQKDARDIHLWKFDGTLARKILKQSWPMAVSMLGAFIYFNIGQIQVAEMLGEAAAGLYAAGIKFSVFWYFIPTMVFVSVFPHFLKLKEEGEILFKLRLQQLHAAMFWGALLLGVFIFIFSRPLMALSYGVQYAGASDILDRHIWSAVFIFLAGSAQIWYLVHQKTKYIILNNLVTAGLNIILNVVFIKEIGITGPAWSCIISYGVGHLLVPGLMPDSRPLFRDMIRSMNPFVLLSK